MNTGQHAYMTEKVERELRRGRGGMNPSRLSIFLHRLIFFYPVYCDWWCRGEKFLRWSETKGTSGMCEECEKQEMAQSKLRRPA